MKNRSPVEMPTEDGDGKYYWSEDRFYNGNWKLMTRKGPGGFTHWDANPDEEPDGQLYDLAVDPAEQNNLWDAKPEMVKTLLSMLEAEKANKMTRF